MSNTSSSVAHPHTNFSRTQQKFDSSCRSTSSTVSALLRQHAEPQSSTPETSSSLLIVLTLHISEFDTSETVQ